MSNKFYLQKNLKKLCSYQSKAIPHNEAIKSHTRLQLIARYISKRRKTAKKGRTDCKKRQSEARRPNGRNLPKGKTLSAKMPFKAVQAPKCPKCGKSVYANEERLAGDCQKISISLTNLNFTKDYCHIKSVCLCR